jgi:B12-binding domain/radical SAM domain protein
MTRAPLVVAVHVRTGVVALNVVTGALDADARTRGADVVFAKTPGEVAAAIDGARADGRGALVLWSFYSIDFPRAEADLEAVRAASGEGALHVAGGVHATADPLSVLRAGFDLAAIGEGEATTVELFAAIAEGRDPRALRGVAHLGPRGELVSHGPAERHPLDAFPAFNVRHGRWNAIEITRGCVYACAFCQTPFAFKARFRHRSVANVRAHVEAMAEGAAPYVRFVSPTSLSYGAEGEAPDLAAVEALLAAVREAIGPTGKVYFGTFPSEVRPEHVTPEALAIIARYCDNDSLIVGAQSGSERVLEAMRRGHSVGDVVRAVEVAIAAGFRPDVDLLLGFPGETPDERRATVALAERLAAMGARIAGHAFLPLPGTPLEAGAPEPIEAPIEAALARLESRGAMRGQWRRQVVDAQDLVRRRAPR